jgi:hypothetical protein
LDHFFEIVAPTTILPSAALKRHRTVVGPELLIYSLLAVVEYGFATPGVIRKGNLMNVTNQVGSALTHVRDAFM